MRSKNSLFVTLIMGGMICSCVSAQNRADWNCVSNGGGTSSSTSYRLSATIGQPAVGFAQVRGTFNWIGFWSDHIPTPSVVQSIAEAKTLGDGVFVSTTGKIATSAAGDFGGFFYIEDSLRVGGIRVEVPPSAVSGLARGSAVSVIGTLDTADNGERQITAPIVIVTSSRTPPSPLGMINRSIGGSDIGMPPFGQYGISGGFGLNNIGLLIKTCGRVTSVGTEYVMIDDGSGPIRVDTRTLAAQPAEKDYITVIGISSLNFTGDSYLPMILPRNGEDVR